MLSSSTYAGSSVLSAPLLCPLFLLLLGVDAHAVDSVAVWVGEGNQAHAHYGYAVAPAGDVNGDGYGDVLVGARSYDAGEPNEGRVFVHHGSPSGPSPFADWSAEGDQLLAFFGATVAPAGDVNGDGFGDVIIGSPQWDGDLENEGKAVVYLGSAQGLDSLPVWTREGDQGSATFGSAVGAAGDVNGDGFDDLVVGARGWDGVEDNAGRVFLFLGSPGGPDTAAAWSATGTQDDEALGWSASGAGDVNGDGYADLIIGGFNHRDAHPGEGAAFVYLGSPAGPESAPAWTGYGGQEDASFGWSVGPAGDVNGDGYADVIVGARFHDAASLGGGRAWVFPGTAAGVGGTAIAWFDGTGTNTNLGWSVGTAGDVNGDGHADVIVGAPRADRVWNDTGEARIWLGRPGGLDTTAAWSAGGTDQGALFGWSVAAAGDVDGDGFGDVIVGAYFDEIDHENEGLASVFRGGAERPGTTAVWRGTGGVSAVSYGFAVDFAGDVNGDGFTELLVSDPAADLGQPGEGRVDLYVGFEGGPDTSPAWTTSGGRAGASWGRAIAGAGDVNGDGYDDVLVGAPYHQETLASEGRAALYPGSAAGLAPLPAWNGYGEQSSAFLGFAVAGAGDVNGDGYADFLLGAYQADGAASAAGVVRVHYGAASGPADTCDLLLEGTETGGQYGYAVAGAGDVNRDGYADVIVGEPGATGGEGEEGRAWLHLGSPTGLDPSPAWSVGGDQSGARYGSHVAAAGDVDADGYADVLVVAPLYDDGETDEGVAFLYRGAPAGLEATPAWSVGSDSEWVELSRAGGAGDVNGDGYGDVLVGASRFTGNHTWEGRVSLYLGSPAGLDATPVREWSGGTALARLGSALTGRGDPGGDGWPDLLIGAQGLADSVATGGAAFLFSANRGSGTAHAPRQRRADGTAPIALGGRSDSETSFRVAGLGRSAAGRARIALVAEVTRLAFPFDGTETVRGDWYDTGAPAPGQGSAIALEESVSGLAPGRSLRWRIRFAGTDPRFPSSPWFTLPGNGATEIDLRTSGSPTSAPPSRLPKSAAASEGAGPLVLAVPSPFATAMTAVLRLSRPGAVRVAVHDVTGRHLTTLADGPLSAGTHRFPWDGRDLRGRPVAPGVYFVRAVCNGETTSARAVRVR
jgi:hypothetical protein